jgi:hypothetical protein
MATVEDSVLRTEMTGLESQEEEAPKRVLFLKAMREVPHGLWYQEGSDRLAW